MTKKSKEAWDDCNNWTTKCNECGGIMHFNKNKYTYYCSKCGNVLEV